MNNAENLESLCKSEVIKLVLKFCTISPREINDKNDAVEPTKHYKETLESLINARKIIRQKVGNENFLAEIKMTDHGSVRFGLVNFVLNFITGSSEATLQFNSHEEILNGKILIETLPENYDSNLTRVSFICNEREFVGSFTDNDRNLVITAACELLTKCKKINSLKLRNLWDTDENKITNSHRVIEVELVRSEDLKIDILRTEWLKLKELTHILTEKFPNIRIYRTSFKVDALQVSKKFRNKTRNIISMTLSTSDGGKISRFIKSCPKLSALRIYCLNFTQLQESNRTKFIRPNRQVKELYLQLIYTDNRALIKNLINAIPNLETFHLTWHLVSLYTTAQITDIKAKCKLYFQSLSEKFRNFHGHYNVNDEQKMVNILFSKSDSRKMADEEEIDIKGTYCSVTIEI